ncbi:MAG: hypothetical protein FWC39_05880 [Bacteroidetes bacterium]|nr:hypothetical protein [Bacteroidota bacterium]
MRKNFLKISLLAAIGLASAVFISCKDDKPTPIPENAVLINGVYWANSNVDAFGSFAATPESPGMFYQWNRKKAWSATEPAAGIVIDNWDATIPTGSTWGKANDPSPKGWRVPTEKEQLSLLDTEKVTNEWIIQNGVTGRKFTDRATGNSLFFPTVGYRYISTGKLGGAGMHGFYWSSTPPESRETDACYLHLYEIVAFENYEYRNFGFSVRPVLAK